MERVSVCLVLPYLPKAETKNPKISLFSKKLKKSSLFNYLLICLKLRQKVEISKQTKS